MRIRNLIMVQPGLKLQIWEQLFKIMGGAGVQTNALAFGGATPPGAETVNTQSFNGTSWTELNNMGTARYLMGAAGSANDAFGAGGYTAPGTTKYDITEEWVGAPVSAKNRDSKLKMNYKKIKGGNYGKHILYSD